MHLRGEAGARQVEGAKIGMTHVIGLGTACGIHIIEKTNEVLRIGLTGDTNNNLKNVAKICDIFNYQNLDFVIHTGDISLPKTLYAFDDLNVPLKGVFGNNDQEEKEDLIKVCAEKGFLFKDIL